MDDADGKQTIFKIFTDSKNKIIKIHTCKCFINSRQTCVSVCQAESVMRACMSKVAVVLYFLVSLASVCMTVCMYVCVRVGLYVRNMCNEFQIFIFNEAAKKKVITKNNQPCTEARPTPRQTTIEQGCRVVQGQDIPGKTADISFYFLMYYLYVLCIKICLCLRNKNKIQQQQQHQKKKGNFMGPLHVAAGCFRCVLFFLSSWFGISYNLVFKLWPYQQLNEISCSKNEKREKKNKIWFSFYDADYWSLCIHTRNSMQEVAVVFSFISIFLRLPIQNTMNPFNISVLTSHQPASQPANQPPNH